MVLVFKIFVNCYWLLVAGWLVLVKYTIIKDINPL